MEIGCGFSHDKTAYRHDMRITVSRNVSADLIKDNVVIIDKLQGKTEEEYIDTLMQPVIDEFNAKQKRKDRKINVPYSEYWKNNGKLNNGSSRMVYEGVLSYGEHETLGKMYYEEEDPDKKAKIREEFINDYKKMVEQIEFYFPHINILYATIHFDEEQGTPHCHIGYCGIADNYKQGLRQQISIGNALASDGIERVKSRAEAKETGYQISKFYQTVRHEFMIPIVKERGYEIKREQHGKTHYTCAEHREQDELLQQKEKKFNKDKREFLSTAKEKSDFIASEFKRLTELKDSIPSETDVKASLDIIDKADALKGKIDGLYNKIDILERINAGTLHYESFQQKNKETKQKENIYEVPESDLLALMRIANQVELFDEQEAKLQAKEQELDAREDDIIHRTQTLGQEEMAYRSKERELNRRVADFDKEVTEEAKKFYHKFLDNNPDVKQRFESFTKNNKMRALGLDHS